MKLQAFNLVVFYLTLTDPNGA